MNRSGSTEFNVIRLTNAAGNGIGYQSNAVVANNSVFAVNGTGTGIGSEDGSAYSHVMIANNIVEGFNGTGGVPFGKDSSRIIQWGSNALYNNNDNAATARAGELIARYTGGDLDLASSPFADPTSDDFTVDTQVKAGAVPWWYGQFSQYLDIGAVQRVEPAGGSGIIVHPGMVGGLRG